MPRRDPRKAILVLDAMLEFFDRGRRWTRAEFHNQAGQRCLIDARRHVRQQQRIRAAGTEHYLRTANSTPSIACGFPTLASRATAT